MSLIHSHPVAKDATDVKSTHLDSGGTYYGADDHSKAAKAFEWIGDQFTADLEHTHKWIEEEVHPVSGLAMHFHRPPKSDNTDDGEAGDALLLNRGGIMEAGAPAGVGLTAANTQTVMNPATGTSQLVSTDTDTKIDPKTGEIIAAKQASASTDTGSAASTTQTISTDTKTDPKTGETFVK